MVEAASRRDALTDEQRREAAEARRAKLVRQAVGLVVVAFLFLGGWLWERAEPPDLVVSAYDPEPNEDPYSYSTRDTATVRAGGFTFDVSAPARTRDDTVVYRFHMLKTADSDVMLVPTRVVVEPDGEGAEPVTCRLGEPTKAPGPDEEELEVGGAGASLRWSCAYTFPSPPDYLDPADFPANASWPVRFEVSYRSVRFLPLGFWPTGSGDVALAATTTVVYRE